jgi:hypothetical protein
LTAVLDPIRRKLGIVQVPSTRRRDAASFRLMSGRSPPAGSSVFECVLECFFETLHIVQRSYLLRHRNKAIIALAVGDFTPGLCRIPQPKGRRKHRPENAL